MAIRFSAKPDYANSIVDSTEKIKKEFEKHNKVVLILIDALGYYNLKKMRKKSKIIDLVAKKFKIKKVSSVFPPSTAPAIVSLLTGLQPIEHAVYEWLVYSKKLNLSFFPLPFKTLYLADENKFENKKDCFAFPKDNLFTKLKKKGVSVFEINKKEVTEDSVLCQSYNAETSPYKTIPDAFVKLKKALNSARGKSFFYFYLPHYDSEMHGTGPFSDESIATVETIFQRLDEEILQKTNCQVIITADHGCVANKKSICLESKKWFQKKVAPYLKKRYGKTIPITGSPRALFMNIAKDHLQKVKKIFKQKLKKDFLVLTMAEALESNLFGNKKPSKEFIENAGNLILIGTSNKIILFEPFNDAIFQGIHGGLTKQELFVPWARLK